MKFVIAAAAAAMLVALAPPARADAPADARQSVDDAWWTGPLLAPSAGTLPQGHLLFEPYVYDAQPYAHLDGRGDAHKIPRQSDLGSMAYINYGLMDRLTVGVIPRIADVQEDGGRSSRHVGLGDISVQAQYRLTQFQPGSWIPTTSVNVQETLPTGRYDHLDRAADGFGSGADTTTLSLYAQTYFWTPNARILRTRLDLSYAVSSGVRLKDLNSYGGGPGYVGHAQPGSQAFGDLAFEYSATRNWVLALDLWAERDGGTRISGGYPGASGAGALVTSLKTPATRVVYAAPAVEYNFNSRVGVIAGARVVAWGRNVTAAVVPVMAVNVVY